MLSNHETAEKKERERAKEREIERVVGQNKQAVIKRHNLNFNTFNDS